VDAKAGKAGDGWKGSSRLLSDGAVPLRGARAIVLLTDREPLGTWALQVGGWQLGAQRELASTTVSLKPYSGDPADSVQRR